MKWISSKELPVMTDKEFNISDKVLCQDRLGRVYIGYVRYGWDEFFSDPVWTEIGRDMYTIENVVRWIFLRDILAEIST